MRLDRVGDLVADAHDRVERVHGALGDQRQSRSSARRATRRSFRAPDRCHPAGSARRTMRPGGCTRRRIAMAVVVLPQPDSPTRPTISPSIDLETHVVHGAHVARGRGVVDLEIAARPAPLRGRRFAQRLLRRRTGRFVLSCCALLALLAGVDWRFRPGRWSSGRGRKMTTSNAAMGMPHHHHMPRRMAAARMA